MKKIIFSIFAFLTVLIIPNVSAASFSTYISANNTIAGGGTFSVYVGVSNASNLYGFKAPLNYDHSKLELISNSGINGFGVTIGTNLVVDNSVGKTGRINVALLTFRTTSSFTIGQSTVISLGTAEGSDGNTTFSGTGSSLTITNYAPKNSDTSLKNLIIEGQNIGFSNSKTDYSITVDHNVDSIKISGQTNASTSSITGLGTKKLADYNNSFDIVVRAESGATKTFKIVVIRKDEKGNTRILSGVNLLSKLEVKDYPFVFKEDVLDYVIKLKDNTDSLDVATEVKDQNSNVTVNSPDKLVQGENIYKIVVKAENGEEKTYTINAILLAKQEKVEEKKEEKKSSILPLICILEAVLILVNTIVFIVCLKTGKLIVKGKKK